MSVQQKRRTPDRPYQRWRRWQAENYLRLAGLSRARGFPESEEHFRALARPFMDAADASKFAKAA